MNSSNLLQTLGRDGLLLLRFCRTFVVSALYYTPFLDGWAPAPAPGPLRWGWCALAEKRRRPKIILVRECPARPGSATNGAAPPGPVSAARKSRFRRIWPLCPRKSRVGRLRPNDLAQGHTQRRSRQGPYLSISRVGFGMSAMGSRVIGRCTAGSVPAIPGFSGPCQPGPIPSRQLPSCPVSSLPVRAAAASDADPVFPRCRASTQRGSSRRGRMIHSQNPYGLLVSLR